VRPLPQLTPVNEWFWTSGADGRLRIQGCTDCKALVHPPVPGSTISRRLIAERPTPESTVRCSEGRTHGFGFIYEALAQLRHEAGDRQVAGARTAVVTSGGGTPSGVMLLRRDGT
jgi:hypothetical protein